MDLEPFLSEACFIAPNARCVSLELYLLFTEWCVRTRQRVIQPVLFSALMKKSGFTVFQDQQHEYFLGLSILPRYRRR